MADNYTALKSSQKKRYISKETFNSLDLSTIPVGSEYEVVNPIEKGDLSADINNALNKAEKSISEPTNQTTGSDGDVLVKKGGGSEWKSISTPTVVQGTGQSTTDVMSQKAVTDSLPDMSNVAYTNKTNAFTSPQRIRNEVRVYPQDSYEPNDSFASFGVSTNYKWGFISAYNKDDLKGINVAIPGKTGTLALTSDVDAKSSFSVEVW